MFPVIVLLNDVFAWVWILNCCSWDWLERRRIIGSLNQGLSAGVKVALAATDMTINLEAIQLTAREKRRELSPQLSVSHESSSSPKPSSSSFPPADLEESMQLGGPSISSLNANSECQLTALFRQFNSQFYYWGPRGLFYCKHWLTQGQVKTLSRVLSGVWAIMPTEKKTTTKSINALDDVWRSNSSQCTSH